MKRFFVAVTVLALLSIPALAAKNSQTVVVPMAVRAGSAELAPGNYDLTWTGSGSSVQITFTRNKKVIVTLPAKLIEENNKREQLETGTKSGVDILYKIRTRNMTLVLEDAPSSGQ
jgi:hypothetical protein